MQVITFIEHLIALLSRMYLGFLIGLFTWATLPLLAGWTPTIVMSGSMEPNIMVGDILVAQNLTSDEKQTIAVGHVLLAKDPSKPEKLVTHRVINVLKGEGFITKGDANAKADPTLIPIENVQGLERLRIPLLGLPVQALRAGDAFPLISFILVTVIAQLVMLGHKKKHLTPEKETEPKAKTLNSKSRSSTRKRRKLARFLTLSTIYSLVLTISIVTASSAANFSGVMANNANQFSAASKFNLNYRETILANSPFAYYRFDESTGMTAADSSGNGRNANYSDSSVTYNSIGALVQESPNKAVTLNTGQGNGQSDGKGSGAKGSVISATRTTGLQTFSTQIWFKTLSNRGGKLIGFSSMTGSTETDRVLYLTPTGQVSFGIDSATKKTLQTTTSYNDGRWHMATATLTGANASLYVDGKLMSSTTVNSAPSIPSGYWIMGGESFSGWLNQPSISFLDGSIDEAVIYAKALTTSQIANIYGTV